MLTPKGRLGFEHPAMAGTALLHTDLTAANLIVTPRGLRLVDWAMATRGAPWIELAMLVPWLIAAGHTAEQAEHWLSRNPVWVVTKPALLDYFASKNAAKWQLKSRQSSAGWMHDLADWTARWADYRCGR
ncbi:phosphotransferase family protein [Actinoplanes flavus]|uniref:phosphotransferase family protein n=1 Tax=Actinoplanes flavus TaxID=2820290 RepID=UPI001EE5B795|nr:phosphotransferase [Actinoplanes flavus]